MLLLIREPDDLVLNGRAIARANPLDDARKQGRPIQVLADDPGRLGGCVGNIAVTLPVDSVENGPDGVLWDAPRARGFMEPGRLLHV